MAEESITITEPNVQEKHDVEEVIMPPVIQPSKELSVGILELYQRDLLPIQEHVKELSRNQGVLRDITQNEITQINENIMIADIAKTFENMRLYQQKLVGMKKEMNNLTMRIDKFKIRAQKLQLQKERDELEAAQEKERQRKYEKELTAKTANTSASSSS